MKRILTVIALLMVVSIGYGQVASKSPFTAADGTREASVDSLIPLTNQTPSTAGGQIYSNMLIAYNTDGANTFGLVAWNKLWMTDSNVVATILGAKQTTGPASVLNDELLVGYLSSTNKATAQGHFTGVTYATATTMYVNHYRAFTSGGTMILEKVAGAATPQTIAVGDTIFHVTIGDSTKAYCNSTLLYTHVDTRHRYASGVTSAYPAMRLRTYAAPAVQPAWNELLVGRSKSGAAEPPPATDTVAPTLTLGLNVFAEIGGSSIDTSKSFYFQGTIADVFANKKVRVDTMTLGGTFAGLDSNITINTADPGNKSYQFTTKTIKIDYPKTFLARIFASDSAGNASFLDTITVTIGVLSSQTMIHTAYISDGFMSGSTPMNTWGLVSGRVTHVIHFSADPVPGTSPFFSPVIGDSLKLARRQAELITYAHANGIKVLICLGGIYGTGDDNMTTLLQSGMANVRTYVSSISSYCKRKGYDGVDLDWEGPNGDAQESLRDSLLTILRDTLNTWTVPGIIHMAVESFRYQSMHRAHVESKVDIINIMNYDMGNSTYAGFNAPISRGTCALPGGQNWTAWVINGAATPADLSYGPADFIAAGYTPSKLALGIPIYAWEHTNCAGPCQLRNGASFFRNYSDVIAWLNQYPNSYRWDDSAKVPYLILPTGSFVSYDDSISVGIKTQYAQSLGLGGVMSYEMYHGYLNNPPSGKSHTPGINGIGAVLGAGGTIVTTPQTPTNGGTPANNATGVDVGNITFTASSVSNATTYIFQLSTSSTFSNFVVNQPGLTSPSHTVTGAQLNPGTTYRWRWAAANASGTSAFSNANIFTTKADSTTASVPTLVSPTANATGQALNTVLRWNPSAGATSYAIEVRSGDTLTGTIISSNTAWNDTTYPLFSLVNGTNYFWKVRANVTGGTNSIYTGFRRFTTAPVSSQVPSTETAGKKIRPVGYGKKNRAGKYVIPDNLDQPISSVSFPIITNEASAETSSSVYWGNGYILQTGNTYQLKMKDTLGNSYNLSSGIPTEANDFTVYGLFNSVYSAEFNNTETHGTANFQNGITVENGDVTIQNGEFTSQGSAFFTNSVEVNAGSMTLADRGKTLSGEFATFLTLVDTVHRTGQTAAITTTNFRNTVAGETYLLLAILQTTTTGSGTGTFTLAWNSGAAKTVSTTWNQASTAYAGYNATYELIYNASGTPTWATSGMAGGVVYEVIIKLYKLP